MIRDYKSYIRGEYYFSPGERLAMGLAVWVLGGFLGFIYEVIFYWANTGFKTFYLRGGAFGPWIDTYCILSLVLLLVFYKIRRYPWLVFILGTVGCTLGQGIIGAGLYYIFDGTRAWNCNLEILNYGSIGGFICVRTAVEYAVLTLLIMYVVMPLVYHMACSVRKGSFIAIWLIIGLICVADIAYNDIACSIVPSLTSAGELYRSLGFRYMIF